MGNFLYHDLLIPAGVYCPPSDCLPFWVFPVIQGDFEITHLDKINNPHYDREVDDNSDTLW